MYWGISWRQSHREEGKYILRQWSGVNVLTTAVRCSRELERWRQKLCVAMRSQLSLERVVSPSSLFFWPGAPLPVSCLSSSGCSLILACWQIKGFVRISRCLDALRPGNWNRVPGSPWGHVLLSGVQFPALLFTNQYFSASNLSLA